MNTHSHAWVRHLSIQWNKNIQTECYILLAVLQTKCYTSSAQKKRTWFSRSTNTIASSRQRNHEERRQKRLFLFFLSTFWRRCNTTREARKQKICYFFPNPHFAEHASTKREAWFFFRFSLSDRIAQNATWKIYFFMFSFFFSSNLAECAGQRREAQ